jgi:tetratricopeptide (TPR) repeat protein
MWQDLMGDQAGTPAGDAQELLYQAYEEPDPRKRVRLAQKAVEIYPDCADAYTLLAEHARSPKEALELYEKAVAAAERALGPQNFQRAAGHFWGILETRPYMRAREGLAHTLWTLGRRDEAVGHLQEMLRLNPNDNQGLRYTLAGFLLNLDRDADLARLLDQYPEDGMATWNYTRALLAFRQKGDTPETRQLLKVAVHNNKHVPAYLLGDKFPPLQQPPYYGRGDENEALIYIAGSIAAWKATPGALAWLREVVAPPKKAPKPRRGRGPGPLVKKRLAKVPQEEDVWQVGFQQLPRDINVAGERVRPWLVLVASQTTGLLLGNDIVEEAPPPELLWDVLAKAVQRPAAGEPHRPTELQVRAGEVWEALRPHLQEAGIDLVVAEELDPLDALFRDLGRSLAGEPQPGLLDVPGVTPEMVGSFYEAAAEFYREAPWRRVGYESAIKVECPKFQSGPWYAVVMGQSGLTFGLALYEDLKLLQKMWAGRVSDEENARRTVATTVTFNEQEHIPTTDLEAVRRYGWKVARPDAYPSVFHKDRGMSMRPPLAWELKLMEACLHAIPGFVQRRPQDDPTPENVTVRAAGEEVPLVLAWVV